MKTAQPSICIASRRFYCSELGFIAILESVACDAVKFSGATEDKFKSKTARQSSKFKSAAVVGTAMRQIYGRCDCEYGSMAAGCD